MAAFFMAENQRIATCCLGFMINNPRLGADGDTSWDLYLFAFTAQRRIDNKGIALAGDGACGTDCLTGVTGKAFFTYLQGH